MSLTYIVDGYNLIKRSSKFRHLELRAGRDGFLSYLEVHRPHGSSANRLIVVFDGSSSVFGFKQDSSFEVVFTQGESADDRIKALVASSRQPKNIVVVTDDRSLGLDVRCAGAKIMTTCAFLDKGIPAKRGAPWEGDSVPSSGTSELNIVERDKITEEMKRIWLKKM